MTLLSNVLNLDVTGEIYSRNSSWH